MFITSSMQSVHGRSTASLTQLFSYSTTVRMALVSAQKAFGTRHIAATRNPCASLPHSDGYLLNLDRIPTGCDKICIPEEMGMRAG